MLSALEFHKLRIYPFPVKSMKHIPTIDSEIILFSPESLREKGECSELHEAGPHENMQET